MLNKTILIIIYVIIILIVCFLLTLILIRYTDKNLDMVVI